MYKTLIKPFYSDVKNFVLDTLFPISCLSCGKEKVYPAPASSNGDLNRDIIAEPKNDNCKSKLLETGAGFICTDCSSLMKPQEHLRCIVCQKPVPFGLTHSGCQTPHGADGLISFYNYHDDKVAKILIAAKYSFIPSAYTELGKIIAEKIKKDFPYLLQTTHYQLCPIPLNSFRQRWRGFNQAEILCQTLSQELGLPTSNLLVRSKLTQTQKNLKKEARTKNMEGAFVLSPLFAKEGVRGSSFILVDDVTTTGATLQEAAKVLKRNGASKVVCLTVAMD